jgi:hypothetical protein
MPSPRPPKPPPPRPPKPPPPPPAARRHALFRCVRAAKSPGRGFSCQRGTRSVVTELGAGSANYGARSPALPSAPSGADGKSRPSVSWPAVGALRRGAPCCRIPSRTSVRGCYNAALASLLRGGGQHPGHQQNECESQRQEFGVDQRKHLRYLLGLQPGTRTLRRWNISVIASRAVGSPLTSWTASF